MTPMYKRNLIKASILYHWLVWSAFFLFVLTMLAGIYYRPLQCTFISLSEYESKLAGVYTAPGLSVEQLAALSVAIDSARGRVAWMFGDVQAYPLIIAGHTQETMNRFGGALGGPGMNHRMPWGAYIVLGPEGLNTDVIAHELVHAELMARLGWWKRESQIPAWFDEGLALIPDYRYRYSGPIWAMLTVGGRFAPSLQELANMKQFMQISQRSPYLSYYTSMVEVKRWLRIVGWEGMHQLLAAVRQGEDFHRAYRRLERTAFLKENTETDQ